MLDGIDAHHNIINLFTGTIADHRLIYRGEEYHLKEYAGEQKLLKIEIKRVSLLSALMNDLN